MNIVVVELLIISYSLKNSNIVCLFFFPSKFNFIRFVFRAHEE